MLDQLFNLISQHQTIFVIVLILIGLILWRYFNLLKWRVVHALRNCFSKKPQHPCIVSIVGTQGIPGKYGGFETLVEQLTAEIPNDQSCRPIEYKVFCSSTDLKQKQKRCGRAKLYYTPLSANGISSIPYDCISLFRAMGRSHCILLLGVSGAIFLPFVRFFTNTRIVTNIDGLEWKREKWGGFARWFLHLSERIAVRFSHCIIADNKAIQQHAEESYGCNAELIAYGYNHAMRDISETDQLASLDKFGVEPHKYNLSICRIEPENNCHLILEAAALSGAKLLFIGNWERSKYGRELKAKYSTYQNIIISNPVYDLDTLFALRRYAMRYIHGHSAGGTNPSLVEAMIFGNEIAAYDVVYNRFTTNELGLFFDTAENLSNILKQESKKSPELTKLAQERYNWDIIRMEYENLFVDL